MDRRVARTRHALVDAYNAIVLGGRRGRIRLAEVLARANVGRSTFYAHYRGTDALHLDSLRRPFACLADAAAGDGNEALLAGLLGHFWDYRQRARNSFDDAAERLLANMVEERLPDAQFTIPRAMAARQLAAAAITPIRCWVGGEAWCIAGELAAAICSSCRAQRSALTAAEPAVSA
jgi:AcrR family transcriptional regulator